MRVISGKHKGRRIDPPGNLPVRPTTDLAKEALFNILVNRVDLEGALVLDLCAGTGNVSYEFASRGARSITAVDVHRGCLAFIRSTAEKLDLPIRTVMADAVRFVNTDHSSYDLIFCDLPFSLNLHTEVAKAVLDRKLLSPHGLLVMEHGRETDLSALPGYVEMRKYGKVHFSFFCSASNAQ